MEVRPISVPDQASGVASVTNTDAIVSRDSVYLSGADLHGFGLPISDPARFGVGVCLKSSVSDLSPYRSDSGEVSSVRAVLLLGLAGDSRAYAATSVAVAGAAYLLRLHSRDQFRFNL